MNSHTSTLGGRGAATSKPERKTILVVEDEQIVALDLQERLEQMGYRVPVTVATGKEAIGQAHELKPDLILMDIKLQGGIDGIDAAARIHETLDVPIVYLTAFGDEATVGRAELTEPYGYVLKPFKERELKIAMEMALFRHRIMHELATSEAWLAATIQSVSDAVVAVGTDDTIKIMNAEAERLTGWSRDGAAGRHVSEVVCLEAEESVGSRTCSCSGRADPPRTWLRNRAGTTYCIEFDRNPLRGPHGDAYGAVLVFRDVSERHRRQETQRIMIEAGAALASTLDMDAVLAALSGLIVPTVAEGYVVYVVEQVDDETTLRVAAVGHAQDAARHALGQGLGKTLMPKTSALAEQVVRTGTSQSVELNDGMTLANALGMPGEAAVDQILVRSLACVPLAARGQTFGALTLLWTPPGRPRDALDVELAEDLGRRVAAALDNATLYGAAQRAIRVRDDMMAIVSHDLRNPLTTVLANTEHLLRLPTTDASTKTKGVAQGIRRAALRMQRLIGDLLDVARIDKKLLTLDLGSCSVGSLVDEALDAFQTVPSSAAKAARIVAAVDCPDTLVHCDRERVAQVFSNLLSNARAWTPVDGTITVSADICDGYVRFGVHDTGAGIRESELPNLFQRFFRGTGAGYSGAGLGLYISKGIIDTHGGRIWVESKLGAGSSFYFTLTTTAPKKAAC